MSSIKKTLAEAKKEIEDVMKSTYPETDHGGKKLRGSLPVIISDCFGGDHEKAVKCGAAIEFLHQGSLVHDDILDEHEERRSNPTKMITEGIKKSLLMGDLYFTKAIKIGAESGISEAKAIAETMETVLGGAIKELSLSDIGNKILTGKLEDSIYYSMIDAKTSAMFGCASKFGAMSFTDDEDVQDEFFKYGMLVGRAYQIADDLCDMISMADGDKEIIPLTIIPILPAILKYNKTVIKTLPLKAILGRIDLVSLASEGLSGSNMSSKMLDDIRSKIDESNDILEGYEITGEKCPVMEYAKFAINEMLSESGESI